MYVLSIKITHAVMQISWCQTLFPWTATMTTATILMNGLHRKSLLTFWEMLHLRLHTAVIICCLKVIRLPAQNFMLSFRLHPAMMLIPTKLSNRKSTINSAFLMMALLMQQDFYMGHQVMFTGMKAVFPLRTGSHL